MVWSFTSEDIRFQRGCTCRTWAYVYPINTFHINMQSIVPVWTSYEVKGLCIFFRLVNSYIPSIIIFIQYNKCIVTLIFITLVSFTNPLVVCLLLMIVLNFETIRGSLMKPKWQKLANMYTLVSVLWCSLCFQRIPF